MDRSILESDPHSVIEGMIVSAYAVGTSNGYIYVRAEYPLAIKRFRIALKQAEERGFLGRNILGSNFSFTIQVKEGAGAFVCGESTALMHSIEGKRGVPRPTPPRSVEAGLWGKPTSLNNVKTFATVPVIINRGADWYASIGTEGSKGTAVFALTGKIANSGLVEVPMGTTLREIIFDIGGGIPNGKRFKAAQTGGPSGGCLPSSLLDLPVDYEALTKVGSMMGSGGMVVVDEDTCMVDLAKFFLSFTQDESCGMCVPCRWGTKQMLDILEDITHGRGKPEDIDLLLELGESIKVSALCGLGQSAPNPVLSTIRYFRNEYEEHTNKKRCSALVCKGIVIANCRHTCPAGIDVPRYIRFIAQGRFAEALAVIREKIPFPSVCGYACLGFCETKCRRAEVDDPIAIRALKRFVADQDTGLWKANSKVAPATGKRIGIIGAGPAGLTAAYYLTKLGHTVTVFEALPEPCGMMQIAIPEPYLPKEALQRDIDTILELGIELKLNTAVSRVDDLFDAGCQAVFVAVGAYRGAPRLGLPSKDGETTPWGTIAVDPDTLATARSGVFAGGDAVTGIASVIKAIAAGRQAATSIDKYLGGNGVIDEILAPLEEAPTLVEVEEGEKHRPVPYSSPMQRLAHLSDLEPDITAEAAIEEAKRCLRCDLEEE
jgi:NADH-quinone oxidoreductase subunit F